jgi:hypothetical protein
MAFIFIVVSTKTKQMTFRFCSAGTKQMKSQEILSFSTKTKQTTFSFVLAEQNQMNTKDFTLI